MNNEKAAEYLRARVFEVEESRKRANPNDKIITVHIDPELFLKMAYLFIGIHLK
jgi:hypothetical protein